MTDLLAYKEAMLARRHTVLDELTALSQELGMGYRPRGHKETVARLRSQSAGL